MSLKTEDEALEMACFEAEMFGASQQLADGPGPTCIASKCMAWRWSPLMTSPKWIAAVKQCASEIGNTILSQSIAVSAIANDPAKYGLPNKPDQGYCGLVGKPEVL